LISKAARRKPLYRMLHHVDEFDMALTSQNPQALAAAQTLAEARYRDLCGRNLVLDMTRGKPAPDQLDLSDGILTVVAAGEYIGETDEDYRNYGLGTGIPEAKRMFADFLEVAPDEIVIGGNSSLNLMYDTVAGAVLFGMPGSERPWGDETPPKFICPVPGYDRHFLVCEKLGFEMLTVEMNDDGPDMDAVEALVANDLSVKAIWCVPKYSNPTGAIYSDVVVERLAAMKTAAPDFRVFWDNAYAEHHLGSGPARVKNIMETCKAAGNPDRPLLFGSTSKVTYAGAGVAVMGGSKANMADAAGKMSVANIGHDKINELRHVRFFGDLHGLRSHMSKHAELIGPKFAAVEAALERHLSGKDIAIWTKPEGGYFVSVDVLDGCAAEIVRLSGEAGVKLTPAGATFPKGEDPRDRNIRLAPTFPSLEEVKLSMEVFCACVELVCLRKLTETA